MAIVIRLAAIGVLLLGPWTDESTELSGWDAERFQEIADREADAWVDQPIEYPPGSVVVFDLLAGEDVVATNRAIIIVAAIAELGGTVLLWRTFGSRVAKAFTILGLPLVPMGYLRLDLLVAVIAAAAAVALLARRSHHGRAEDRAAGLSMSDAVFAALTVTAALIKIWPALLIMGAVGVGRRTTAAATAALGTVAGLIWLGVVGAGLDPLDQVLSLRGATGWHLESLPGALIALAGDGAPRLELNAFRIGTIDQTLVAIGRAIAVAMTVALALAAGSKRRTRPPVERLALVMLGSVAALMITAPLLSPQFLLWLTPWGALLLTAAPAKDRTRRYPPLLLAIAIVLTGFTLTIFGPENLADTVPAALLTIRNLSLLAIPAACLIAIRSEPDCESESGSGRDSEVGSAFGLELGEG